MPATVKSTTVTTAATLIVAANTRRQELTVVNASDGTILYLGPDITVTTATGIPLYENQTRERSKGFPMWLGDIYGIVGAGTADCRSWETTQ